MKEISIFKISLDIDLSRLKGKLAELDKFINGIQSTFDDLSERISKVTEANVPNIDIQALQNAQRAFQNLLILLGLLGAGDKLNDIFNFVAENIGPIIDKIKEVVDKIKKLSEDPPPDLERLQALETQAKDLLVLAEFAKEEIKKQGEAPVDKEFIQERIELLNILLEKIALVREELTHGALKSGIPEQSLTPIPKFGQPGEVQVLPLQRDRIQPLEDELRKILEDTNRHIEERSQLMPLLENAYASLEGKTSVLIANQSLMSDALNGSTISAVNLAEKGINPLTGKASELGISLEDLFQNTSEGAVIFGFTKEELEKLSTTTGDVVGANEQLTDTLSTQNDVLEHGSGILELTDEELLSLGDKYAMLSDESGNYTDAAKQASTTTADLTGQNSTYSKSQDQVNQTLEDGSVAFDNVGASAEEFGETLDKVENQGGFFEGIKQGFIDFVENVQSNSELMADFFANTLSQMSQSFSDLFFNIITGKFDDLKDLAKQAFEAILRAFLDLVSAIATRQIVISIGGLFGIGKGAQAAGGGGNPVDIAQQGAGVVGSGLGLFGSGGAFETLKDEEMEYRLAA